MIKLIQDLSVFSLLGLNEIPEADKTQIVEAMDETLFGLVMQRFGETHTPEQFESLLGSIGEATDESLTKDYPEIQKFIEEESYIYKKNTLLDSVNSEIDFLNTAEQSEDTKESLEICENLKAMLSDETSIQADEDFEMAWKSYVDYLNSNSNNN